jgi:hypothetical protein
MPVRAIKARVDTGTRSTAKPRRFDAGSGLVLGGCGGRRIAACSAAIAPGGGRIGTNT